MLLACALIAILLGSYSPYDPGMFHVVESDGVSNLLGPMGANIATRIIGIVGLGSWAVCAVMFIWGVRFIIHANTERFFKCLVFLPILLAIASVFATTIKPFDWWNHHFGLGGMFGETVNQALVNLWYFNPRLYQDYASLIFGTILGMVAFHTFGFTMQDVVQTLFSRRRHKEVLKQNLNPGTGEAIEPREVAGTKKPSLWSRFSNYLLKRYEKEEEVVEEQDIYDFLSGQEDSTTQPEKSRFGRLTRLFKYCISLLEDKEPVLRDRANSKFTLGQASPKGHELDSSVGAKRHENREDGDAQADDFRPTIEEGLTRPIRQSRRARNESQVLPLVEEAEDENYEGPPLSLLNDPEEIFKNLKSQAALEESGNKLKQVLADFSVHGNVEKILQGPVVTQYKFRPAAGVKTSRVVQLADDIARLMSALSARVTTIPGEPYVGIELPAENRETVYLKELVQSATFGDSKHKLPLIFGKDISGHPVVVDLVSMPHLLIAGTTGSGKSVGLNSMILSLLYKLSPDQCKIMMIDPKMIELSGYDGIPHLISPVVTDPKKAIVGLKWVTYEMNKRYEKMQNMKLNIKNIQSFNNHMRGLMARGESVYSIKIHTGYDKETNRPMYTEKNFDVEVLPYIVVIIDELADLVQTAGKEIDECLQQLSQKARASGIHLIAATQRPSVDVINGIIKSNFPNRVSFQVSSKIDSRTILNTQGAEQLLGRGDMLYMSGGSRIQRVHGPYVSDEEVEKVVAHLKETFGEPLYVNDLLEDPEGKMEAEVDEALGFTSGRSGEEDLYNQAVAIVKRDRRISISYIQRKLSIGYNKAAKIVERMEEEELISQPNNVGKREIFIPE